MVLQFVETSRYLFCWVAREFARSWRVAREATTSDSPALGTNVRSFPLVSVAFSTIPHLSVCWTCMISFCWSRKCAMKSSRGASAYRSCSVGQVSDWRLSLHSSHTCVSFLGWLSWDLVEKELLLPCSFFPLFFSWDQEWAVNSCIRVCW